MADTAVFSSFHRPRPRRAEVASELPGVIEAAPSPLPPPLPDPVLLLQVPGPDWADLSSVGMDCDQLGLTHPAFVSLLAGLPGLDPISLESYTAGIYRPPGFRTAPWSGFAYDQASSGLTGLATGTRILTARGEVAVERLVPGDAAMALRGPALLPIAWIGRSAAASPPVVIEAGALGPNIPRKNLTLGADQKVFLQPAPVTAQSLVNGTTVRLVETDLPDLFHIDVARPEVLLAEGLALSSGQRSGKNP